MAMIEINQEIKLSSPPRECRVRKYLVAPYQIHYLRFIVEAYPGIGVVSTIDPALGLVSIAVAPGCESDMESVLQAESTLLRLREVSLDDTRPPAP